MSSQNHQSSVFRTAIKAFFKTIAVMVGIGVGLVPLLLIIATASGSSVQQTIPSTTKIEVLPGPDGTRKALEDKTPVILHLDVQGMIGLNELTTDKVRALLTESREGKLKDDRVKAVLVSFRTPGGSVVDSDGIYRALLDYKAKYNVPIYAYVDGLCASGGVYISMACDKIYASDVSLIGSVGVILNPFLNFTGLMEKLGVESRTISAGKDKDALNPLRPWKEGEDQNYRALVDAMYDQFVGLVSKHRPQIEPSTLVNQYGAHIFTATDALKNGLIDETASQIEDVMKALAEKAGVGDDYQVVRLKKKGVWADLLDGQSVFYPKTITHQLDLGAEFHPKLRNQPLYLYSPGSIAQQ